MNHPFERSSCDCGKCTAACRCMPGTVAPGELEEIAAYLGVPCDDAFAAKYFEASDGPLVAKEIAGTDDVHWFRIPTIVPKLMAHGCVFLSEGRCTIHPVAPFGCAMHKVCVTEPDADEKTTYVLRQIMQSHVNTGAYTKTLAQLAQGGHITPPLAMRKEAFARELLAADNKQGPNP